jgi:hypothetical protein
LRHDHRGAERRDRRRRRPIDAFDQLNVVLDDDVDGEITLNRYRELGQQILVLLTDIEQNVLAQCLCALRVGDLQLRDRGGEPGIEPLGDVDVRIEAPHRSPEVLLLQVERDVVLGQFVLAVS